MEFKDSRLSLLQVAYGLLQEKKPYGEIVQELCTLGMQDKDLRSALMIIGGQRVVFDAARFCRLSPGMSRKPLVRLNKSSIVTRLELWKLESGISLGEARREDLLAAARQLEATALGVFARAIFYRRLAARLPDDLTHVSQVLTDDDVDPEFSAAQDIAATIFGVEDGDQ